jgi:hypothetical protein
MVRWVLVLALIACSSEDKPRQIVEDKAEQAAAAGHAAKVKALEAAQLAAREAEAAARVATEAAEKAKAEMLAAKGELAKTSAERAKLADEGRALLATARTKLGDMEMDIARLVAKRDAMRDELATMTAQQRQNAAAGLAEMNKKVDESAEQLRRLRATMAELEKSLAQ